MLKKTGGEKEEWRKGKEYEKRKSKHGSISSNTKIGMKRGRKAEGGRCLSRQNLPSSVLAKQLVDEGEGGGSS